MNKCAPRVTGRPDFPSADQLRLIIFDCDGVLFDSREANVAFYDAILAAEGLPPLDEEGRRLCYALSGTQLYARLFSADPELHRRVSARAKLVDYGPFYPLMIPVDGLRDTLARLSAHCPLAMATNRGRTVDGVVEHFEIARFFAARLGVLDVARPKPAPDLLLTCLERLSVTAEAAVYVGDSDLDRRAAEAASIAYIGIGSESGARMVVEGIRELPDLLLG